MTMSELLDDIGQLLQASEPGSAARTGADDSALQSGRPAGATQAHLVLMADHAGRALWTEQSPDEGTPAEAGETPGGEVSELCAALAERLRQRKTCRFSCRYAGKQAVGVGLRLGRGAESLLVGAVFDRLSDQHVQEEMDAARLLVSALAGALQLSRQRIAHLSCRVEHLRNEQQALRTSHAEALTAAISEREQRVKEQEEHVRQLRAVMMMAADGIVTADEQGRIESFNEHACSIFGYSAEEAIGRPVTILIPPEQREQHRRALKRWARKGDDQPATFRREVIAQRKDGSRFPLDLAVSRVNFGPRRIFTAIMRDISQRKKAEEELRRLHVQNELILNSAGEGICGLSRQGKIIFANPAAARMLGWSVEELVGRPLHQTAHHSHPDGRPLAEEDCPVCAPLAGRPSKPLAEYFFWRKDGTSFPVEYTCTPIGRGEELSGAVLTFRDITERRALEAQLHQAQKLESIGQLAAGIAHEINTPTQYIGDNAHFLQESFEGLARVIEQCRRLGEALKSGSQLGEAAEAVLDAMEEADAEFLLEEIPAAIRQSLEGVERVSKIVRSMKEFSHPGGEEKQAVDLNRAIESTLTISRNEWKYVADTETHLQPNLPLVMCLPGEINQVILNLVVNAAHAIGERVGDSGQKGKITVTTCGRDGWVEIRISDTGTGIPEAIRSKVFDPFFTTKPVGRGTGQGLAIAHSVIVEKHGGTITFETKEGHGTTFIIRLPVEPPEAP